METTFSAIVCDLRSAIVCDQDQEYPTDPLLKLSAPRGKILLAGTQIMDKKLLLGI